jgi:hypothetical protein
MAKENRPLMRRQKGWIGFVRSYKKYVEEGSYDDMDWNTGGTTKPKSVERDKMGKIIQKW